MAFFKFRKSSPSPDGQPPHSPTATAAETVESLRRRALYRLIGAAVLVLLAIIGFPMLFDTQPRPVALEAPIIIPDRDKVPPLTSPISTFAPVASVPAQPVSLPVAASLSAGEEVVAAAGTAASASSAAAAPRAEQSEKPKTDQQIRTKQQTANQQAAEKRKAEQTKRQYDAADAARARALLEGGSAALPSAASGQSAHQARSTSAPAAATRAERYVVQIGAFTDARSAQAVRQKAERAGVKTHIQNVTTSAGRHTRVRAGPFASRGEAAHALAKLKQAGLSGSILAP